MPSKKKKGFETRAIHSGYTLDPTTHSIMPPLYLSTTYAQTSPGEFLEFDYSRAGNPSRAFYEKCLCDLEGGVAGFAFASGCSAIATVMQLFETGDHVIAFDDMYGGTFRLLNTVFKRHGFEFTYVDLTDPKNFQKAIIKGKTKLVFLETPTNPTLKIADIKAISQIARENNVLVAVDNTFSSPYFQKPFLLGADFVIHSATKYLNGHSDVVGGALIVSSDVYKDKVSHLIKTVGAVASPFDCFLVLRSLKTLSLRMKAHENNAKKIAQFLETHPKVQKVLYPGLTSHPQHDLAKKQMTGFGGIVSFFITGGLPASKTFLENVGVFSLAESLGGVESLVCHPTSMTHASVPEENRKKLGITEEFIRLSVGVETTSDLIDDLDQALEKV